ncbi:MAG: alpha-2-macroglobulin [Rhodocyclaceae bacterium]|nr:alpha-2-macroglobulin [Rhodocyclaceae bacterium]
MPNFSSFRSATRVALLMVSIAAGSTLAATVKQFSPQGRIDQQTRATAVFSDDMVRLGEPNASNPFNVTCAQIEGSGRWIDARTWAWQLSRPLQAGERCEFVLNAGTKTLSGEALSGGTRYAFFAGGPWPRSLQPRPAALIEEDQAFVINAGGPIKTASLENRLWCEAEGVGQRIAARPVPAAQRSEILAHAHGNFGSDALVVSCAERLPPGAKMKLVWGKGIEAVSGAASEKQESFVYTVREPFRATLTCEREKAGAPCSPLSALTLEFSAYTDAALLQKIRLVTPEGTRSPKDPARESNQRERQANSVVFPGPFAQEAELRLELPAGIRDDANRPLENAAAFPLKFRTGVLPPLAKFPGSFGILEFTPGEGGVLPVTLRNIEAKVANATLALPGPHRFAAQALTEDADVILAMNALEQFEQQTRMVKVMREGKLEDYEDPYYARELSFLAKRAGVQRNALPKPGGSAEFEVMGIPLAKPGYHIVEIESRLLGTALLSSPKPMFVRSTVLVTNMAVHLKLGKDNALIWVTALNTGKPVSGAAVRLSSCDGAVQWEGSTNDKGLAQIDKAIAAPSCGEHQFAFASARLGEDYSFVRSDWNEGIEPWRFGVNTWGESAEMKIHTIFDRTLFRAGQTVSMKHIARGRNSRGFAVPDATDLPTKLTIRQDETGTEFTQPLTCDAKGHATNQWKIPESAKRGGYEISYSGGGSGRGTITGGEFRVSDFRLPVFTGSVQGVPARQIAPTKVPLALGLSFINGGAAKEIKVDVSATLRPRWPSYSGFDNFEFNVGFDQDTLGAFGISNGREEEYVVLDKQSVTLDKAGAGKLEVTLPNKPQGPSELYAEMSFPDPNGEIQTLRGTVELWPAAMTLGIRVAEWASSSKDTNRAEIVALDTNGKPIAGQEITVTGKRRIDYGHRRRIVGGFYAYENHHEYEDIGELCSGRTDSRGMFLCTPSITQPGSVYLLAQSKDNAGNVVRAGTSYWISGGGDLWFTAGNQDRIDVIPEKREYKAGETARFQVRTPFREATALVSVEAGGIIETHVRPLSRFKPVIELPVKGDWAPNVYVSVLVVRGRIEPLKWYSLLQWGWREPVAWFKEWWTPLKPTAMVDLAKPAYRIGLGEISVGVDAFRLKVEVTSERKDYRPREAAKVTLKVTTPDGKPAPAGTEIAFAAVDQALLELRPNTSWDLLETLMQKRGYEVETATAQSQVIGKRHFGKKAVPAGGGGGRAPARELFDTLLVWAPNLQVGAGGTAMITVPMNDSLTEFKLVGVATSGTSLFGTGSASVRTKQDLQMISGLPPLVRENDRFTGTVTLRNGTARAMQVELAARLEGKALDKREIKLDAEGAAEVRWETQAPEGSEPLVWEFDANETGTGSAKDSLKITQQLAPAVPVTTQQSTFTRIDGDYRVPAGLPTGALPGKGGIEISLSPKLSAPPAGLMRFFEEYPFSCLEQKASIAVGLQDKKRWQEVSDALPALLDGNGLARYFPGEGDGHVVLTAYVLDLASASGFGLPDDARQRMLQGLTGFVEGRYKVKGWSPFNDPSNDLLVRKLLALQAITRQGGPTKEHTRLAAALDVEPARLPTAALIDWYLITKRLPDLPKRGERLAAAEQELRNRLSYIGGRLGFTTERSDYWWWMMISGDTNAFRLLDAVMDDPAWKDDLPKLMRGAIERQTQGRWFTTTANAWASVVLERFGRTFEREQVSGITRAQLGSASAEQRWKADGADIRPLSLPWPAVHNTADTLSIRHEGTGKPWASVQVRAAMPVSAPRAFGYRVTRSVTPLKEKVPGKVSRGDLWRVTVRVEGDQDMSWVVISDPIPAGAKILGDGDGRDSHIATLDEDQRARRVWPTFVERTFDFFRAYYEVVPKGNFQIDYTVRINNAGEFQMPPTRVEGMYAPDVFGEAPNAKVIVGE